MLPPTTTAVPPTLPPESTAASPAGNRADVTVAPVDGTPRLSRRSFLGAGVLGVAGAAATLAGCSDDDDDAVGLAAPAPAPGPTTTSPTAAASPSTAAPTTTAPTTTTAVPRPARALGAPAFTLGVASGDPDATSVVLWTRLAPKPLEGGGMPADDVDLAWEVARDDRFSAIEASGVVTARAADAHTVHVIADGLEANSSYAYRFRVLAADGEQVSPTGRTRTFPSPDSSPERLTFVFASCQDWQSGSYAAWRDAAATPDLDCVVFLGDYIYEDAGGQSVNAGAVAGARVHVGGETVTLDDYRTRYAQYHTDPDLAEAHRVAPWIVTWDDHEIVNNDAGTAVPPDASPERRAAAYQAWWEHQPVRLAPPDGDHLAIHRTVTFGDLARFFVLDGRQYRSIQPCKATSVQDFGTSCDERLAPDRTLLGTAQEDWLVSGLASSSAVWDVLANDVIFSGYDFNPLAGGQSLYLLDTWDGYPAARTRVLDALARNASPSHNTLIVTGDVHASFVIDTATADGRVVATELVGTSITSSYPLGAVTRAAQPKNPSTKWFDDRKGYVRCTVTRDACTAEYRTLADPRDPAAVVATAATVTIAAATPGARVQTA
jgi:alkaline phosphatase D